MNRRSLLVGAGALALTQLAAACDRQPEATLRIRLLKNSIPVQLIGKFRRTLQQRVRLDLKPEVQLQALFHLLQRWNRELKNRPTDSESPIPLLPSSEPSIPDLITIGDAWLAEAIQSDLIQALALERLSNWQRLPRPWQNLVRRDRQGQLSPIGEIWAAPYRWGSTVIAYRRDQFKRLGWTPSDWSDLWRPELQGWISLLDQPREVIGLTLKRLGHSYNTLDLETIPGLETELQALNRQVKFYSSDAYLQPLILGDTWLAVGWSTDVIPLLESNPQIQAVFPASGTALWSDLWVSPKVRREAIATVSSGELTLPEQWIDFFWHPEVAPQLSLLSGATSPVVLSLTPAELPETLQSDALLLPEATILQRSEFLNPLPKATASQYWSLWQTIRGG